MGAYTSNIWKIKVCFQVILIVLWSSNLIYTTSYFSVYALCSAVGLFCLYDNFHAKRCLKTKDFWSVSAVAAVLALAVVLANYSIFQRVRNLNEISIDTNEFLNALDFCITLAGGMVVFYQIIKYAVLVFPMRTHSAQNRCSRKKTGILFLCMTASIWAIYLIYLFLVVYPGSVSGDAIIQILEGHFNTYKNAHPIWHTLMIEGLLKLGYWMFGNPNAAVATYNVVQSLLLACCFGYGLITLYQCGAGSLWIAVAYAMYAFLPHNITYSATIWKDVPFGAAMLLFVTAAYRLLKNIGNNRKLNYVLFFVGCVGVCLMRTNGFASLLTAVVLMVPFLWKNSRKMIAVMAAALVLGWGMVNGICAFLNAPGSPLVEVLSIPIQQISRVISNGGELTEYEADMLGTVIDLEKVPLVYDAEVSDKMKDELNKTNIQYLQDHLPEYGKIWISIGMRYPGEYLEAWIEQTKGYWNGGYDYYIYAEYVYDNEYGIYMKPQNNIVFKLMKAYFTFSRETVIFQPLQSIGLHVWIMLILWFVNVYHKKKEALLFVPGFVIVLGLMVGAPVFSLFRYVYPIFTCLPVLAGVTLYADAGENS